MVNRRYVVEILVGLTAVVIDFPRSDVHDVQITGVDRL